jgi:phosphatidylglycerophosphate synthase
MKKLADLLTGLRFVLASLIAWTAWTSSPEAGIGTLVLLTTLAWTSDILDGPLARRAAENRQSWLGAHDLEADLSVALALAVSLAVWRAAPTALLVVTLLASTFGWLALHSLAPIQLGMGLIYGLSIFMVWGREPILGAAMLGWIGAAILLNPSRAHTQVASFLVQCRKIILGQARTGSHERGIR